MDVAQQAGNKGESQTETPLSLDSSLERVFGPGATLLAKKLESYSDKREEINTSDTELNSDSEVGHVNVSTPAKDQRKKRVRPNIKFGDISSIKGIKDNHGASSEGEHSEEAVKEVKKPRLGENSETQTSEEDDNIEILEKENIIEENNSNHSEDLEEEKVGEKYNTEELKEEDKIFKDLLDLHEGVPLEDPGPNTASEDEGEGAAGATQ